MPDLGQVLYQMYIEACAERNYIVDPWESLAEEDKQDWRKTADNFGNYLFYGFN